MPMRLLSKSDIVRAKSVARKLDIDEGAKLARRIDNLREVAASEEESLTRFRRETIANIHAETSQATQRLNSLKSEVATLEERRKELLRPLTKEWNELRKERKEVTRREDDAQARLIQVQDKEKQIKKAVQQVSNTLARARTTEERMVDKLMEADRYNKDSKTALSNAKKEEEKALKLQEQMTKELARRDMAMAEIERRLDYKEEKLKERENKLVLGWIKLNDRRATLERQIKRLKK